VAVGDWVVAAGFYESVVESLRDEVVFVVVPANRAFDVFAYVVG
jgi:hypothetical protein